MSCKDGCPHVGSCLVGIGIGAVCGLSYEIEELAKSLGDKLYNGIKEKYGKATYPLQTVHQWLINSIELSPSNIERVKESFAYDGYNVAPLLETHQLLLKIAEEYLTDIDFKISRYKSFDIYPYGTIYKHQLQDAFDEAVKEFRYI